MPTLKSKREFFAACRSGETRAVKRLLAKDPGLVRAADPDAAHAHWTGLHTAAQAGHLDAVRLLLKHGADPNAREAGDNTYPLHWAAAGRRPDIVRALLDAGGDIHGNGDVHELDAIGWATFFHEPCGAPGDSPETAQLLLKRGARHNVISAISMNDKAALRALAKSDPKALERRMSRYENGSTALHLALALGRHPLVNLLIKLGADLENKDGNGHTALESAMLHGDAKGVRILKQAGAREPKRIPASRINTDLQKLSTSITGVTPMLYVPDVAAALDWYVSVGFTEIARFSDDGLVNFGIVQFGRAQILINMHGQKAERHDATLWFDTDKADELYQLHKSRQLHAGDPSIIAEHLNDTFYHARQFAIRDLNGYLIYFIQQLPR